MNGYEWGYHWFELVGWAKPSAAILQKVNGGQTRGKIQEN